MPTPQRAPFMRPALAPGLLGAVVLIAGGALIDSSIFVLFRYVVTILALIIVVFTWRGRSVRRFVVALIPLLLAIAVIWNPIWVVPLHGKGWAALQFVAAAVFIAVGVLVKVPSPEADAPASSSRSPRTR